MSHNPDMTSADVLNVIRGNASQEYQNRVPVATQENLETIGDAILNYTPVRNEFVNALYNKVGLTEFVNTSYENPLNSFKSATLEMGDTMEEVFVNLVKATVYDSVQAESEVWKQALPDIQAVFYKVNRRNKYKTTIRKDQMRAAFNKSNPMEILSTLIVASLTESNNYDEFLLMKQLFVVALSKGLLTSVTVPAPTNRQNVEDVVVAIKEVSALFTFKSPDYNFANVPRDTPFSNQILIVTPKFKARYDVALLATSFNMSKAEFEARTILIDKFGDTNGIACLVDERFIVAKDYVLDSDDLWNPEGRYTNFWLHVWQILSTSPFSQAVMFTTDTPVLDSLVLTPATANVDQGNSQQFITEAGAASTGNPSAKATYTVVRVDTNPLAALTGITTLGLLVVDPTEVVGDLTITATSVVDITKTDTATVTVVAHP